MGTIENIQSLIAAANATTGKTDADMTEATKSLIAGYGGGGSGEVTIVLKSGTGISGNSNMWDLGGKVSKLTIDVNGQTGYNGTPIIKFFAVGDNPDGAVVDVINADKVDIKAGDFFRQVHNLRELRFKPKAYITDVYRFFDQVNDGTYNGIRTITGVSLTKLTKVTGGRGNNAGLEIHWEDELMLDADVSEFAGGNMTPDTIKRLIAAVHDYSGGATHTLTLGPVYSAMLTPDEIQAANAKGWNIA